MEKNTAIDNKNIGGSHELNSMHYANELSGLVLLGTGGDPGFVSLANDSSCVVHYKQNSERYVVLGEKSLNQSNRRKL